MNKGLIALDIGAGTTAFAKKFLARNPQVQTMMCGEPHWKEGLFSKRIKSVEEVMEGNKKGVHKIIASYNDMKVPDESLDILMLNSPHPLMSPKPGFKDEVFRVLKTGGVFYFGHSTHIGLEFGEEQMNLIGGGRFRINQQGFLTFKKDENERIYRIPGTSLTVFPSPVIEANMVEEWIRKNRPEMASKRGSYIYNLTNSLNPNWKAWKKI